MDTSSGWVRAIDEEMTSAHIGVADNGESYEQARDKLKSLIAWHVSVATDPLVNGGLILAPDKPTIIMRRVIQDKLALEGMLVSDWLVCEVYQSMITCLMSAENEK
jgi:hypothetical protein